VHIGIDREHKLSDVVIVKLTYMSLFIMFGTSFADSNTIPFFSVFNRLLVMENVGSKVNVLGSVHIAVMCVIRPLVKQVT
jgi:hypothetical protein